MIKLRHLLSIAVVLGLMLFAPQVHAEPMLQFWVDGVLVHQCGSGIGCASTNAGVVTFAGALGSDYSINFITGITNPVLGGPPHMDLNSFNVQSSAGVHTLDVLFTSTGWDMLNVGAVASFGGTNNGTTIRYQTYFDTSNVPFGTGMPIGDSGEQAGRAFSGTYAGPGPPAGPYSMTQQLTLTSSGTAIFSGSFSLQMVPTSVPESAGVVELLGATLLVAFGARRWQFRRS